MDVFGSFRRHLHATDRRPAAGTADRPPMASLEYESRQADPALDPHSARGAAALAAMELERNNVKKAEALALQALERDGNEPEAWICLAEVRRRTGDLPGAVAAIEYVIALRPGNHRDLFRLGIILSEKGDLDNAIDLLQRAHEGLPEDRGLLDHLSNVLMARGRWADAIDLYETARNRAPAGDQQAFDAALSRLLSRYEDRLPGIGSNPWIHVLRARAAGRPTQTPSTPPQPTATAGPGQPPSPSTAQEPPHQTAK